MNGIGATVCGCKDCHLLTMDYGILGEAARARWAELRRMEDDTRGS